MHLGGIGTIDDWQSIDRAAQEFRGIAPAALAGMIKAQERIAADLGRIARLMSVPGAIDAAM